MPASRAAWRGQKQQQSSSELGDSKQGLSSMLLALRREKEQHLGPKSTGEAKLKLAWALL